ncbi:PLP-dependent aminotransferase family protein [Streptomyces sp. UNOC14_S4]|uniref:MocR-like pyridoxine biosynthesis transcription factor PdxR n=1 Tax=Streptomyces sp. UNOC14_S4 TaxID=2872340 RepID=UPI001E6174F3|nr:PLP-dependent aminotransferase family protein [Streptomyces sp. UNOC14_S4]MCC3767719.1 PLP-dependent aminotransferase family protein [Streptomyces sp. UNOC14_S4]
MERTWAISGAGAGADLHLDLSGPGGVRACLVRALRDAVRTGRLAPDTRLPPSRTLARDLGVARNTVADAYGELVAEGWLTARQGSGTRVARRPAPGAPERRAALPRSTPPPEHDLLSGTADVSSFPRAAWLAAARRALAVAPHDAFGHPDPRGRAELRTALADYLSRVRGVHADPGRIVVCAGFTQGLALLSEVLRQRGTHELGVEEYGLWFHREVLARHGLRTTPLPVDRRGARVMELAAHEDVRAVLLTPAHQFPTGVSLHPDRRAAVIDWAERAGGLVIEDDYDGEFRYDRQSVGSLQGLGPERVVYCGTASKSLASGLRISWMVLPEHLVGDVLRLKGSGEWGSGVLDQLTLAELITSGAYDRHVRAMRLRYRRRRDRLVAALAGYAPHIRVSGIAAGLHVVLDLPAGTERTTLRAAAWQGLALEGLSRFRHEQFPADREGLVVGYGTPPEHAFPGALAALLRILPPAE